MRTKMYQRTVLRFPLHPVSFSCLLVLFCANSNGKSPNHSSTCAVHLPAPALCTSTCAVHLRCTPAPALYSCAVHLHCTPPVLYTCAVHQHLRCTPPVLYTCAVHLPAPALYTCAVHYHLRCAVHLAAPALYTRQCQHLCCTHLRCTPALIRVLTIPAPALYTCKCFWLWAQVSCCNKHGLFFRVGQYRTYTPYMTVYF